MEFQIHCIETEAYGAVLKAFIAQSENLTWDKEGLITELRKELRVSDAEHREILRNINLDALIKSIRECRNGNNDSQQLTPTDPSPAPDPIYVGHVSHRLKPAQMPMVSSPNYPLLVQPSPAIIPHSDATIVQDARWNDNTAVISHQMHARQPTSLVPQKRQTSTFGKARQKAATKKGCRRLVSKNMKPVSENIENHAPDMLINKAEILGGVIRNMGQTERCKLFMKEHGRAIVDTIGELVDVSDEDTI